MQSALRSRHSAVGAAVNPTRRRSRETRDVDESGAPCNVPVRGPARSWPAPCRRGVPPWRRGGVRMGDWGWCLVNAPPSQPRSRWRSRGSRTSSHSLSQSQNLALSQPRHCRQQEQTERVRSSKGFLTAQHCTGLHSLPGSATERNRSCA